MNLNIWQETKPVGSNVLVGAIYKNSAPTVLVDHYTFPGAYTGQTQLHTFAGLQNVVYIYKLFESPDGLATGVVRNQFEIQPNSNTYNVRDDLYLIADISSFFASGGSTYGADSSLVGWNWRLERKGQGTQNPGIEYVKTKGGIDTTIDDTDADGFRLATGDLIGPNEQFIIHFQPQLAATSTAGAPSLISATTILTANTTLDNSAVGQCYWLMGAGGYFEVTLPDLATVPDNVPIYFLSDGGSHINASIKCFTGQKIQWYKNQTDWSTNTLATRMVLGQVEKQAFYCVTMPDATKRWVMLFPADGANSVGQIIHSYSRIGMNNLFLDGNQSLSRTTYARLWDWIQALDASCIVSGGSWNATQTVDGQTYNINHGKFSTGNGTSTFGVPKIYDYGFLRAKDGTVGSASYQGFPGDLQFLQLLNHTHESLSGYRGYNGKGTRTIDSYYNAERTLASDLSSPPFNTPGANNQGFQLARIGAENRPDNVGIYLSIKI